MEEEPKQALHHTHKENSQWHISLYQPVGGWTAGATAKGKVVVIRNDFRAPVFLALFELKSRLETMSQSGRRADQDDMDTLNRLVVNWSKSAVKHCLHLPNERDFYPPPDVKELVQKGLSRGNKQQTIRTIKQYVANCEKLLKNAPLEDGATPTLVQSVRLELRCRKPDPTVALASTLLQFEPFDLPVASLQWTMEIPATLGPKFYPDCYETFVSVNNGDPIVLFHSGILNDSPSFWGVTAEDDKPCEEIISGGYFEGSKVTLSSRLCSKMHRPSLTFKLECGYGKVKEWSFRLVGEGFRDQVRQFSVDYGDSTYWTKELFPKPRRGGPRSFEPAGRVFRIEVVLVPKNPFKRKSLVTFMCTTMEDGFKGV